MPHAGICIEFYLDMTRTLCQCLSRDQSRNHTTFQIQRCSQTKVLHLRTRHSIEQRRLRTGTFATCASRKGYCRREAREC